LGLIEQKLKAPHGAAEFFHIDCLMSCLSVFTFKFPSLLQFNAAKNEDEHVKSSLRNFFKIKNVPCDTQMRARLDLIHPDVTRSAFTQLFSLLQRGKILESFCFMDKYYLISLDGTGYFSSSTIHCSNCCTKEYRDGQITYHHQILGAALVHPDHRVVFPFAPEPIIKADGDKKNDCERNAAKRWIEKFRREHFLLRGVILADGLSSNEPFIADLKRNDLSFILIAQEPDHKYLFDWFNGADPEDAPTQAETLKDGTHKTYQYMKDVPLNSSKDKCLVNVVRYTETKKGQTRTWVWVTDLEVNEKTVKDIVKGGRCRWKIENETFNTLKNQGYNFEHNYGQGNKYLSTIMAHLMLLAFFVDKILQGFDKKFQACYKKMKSKHSLWERIRSFLAHYIFESFDDLYSAIIHPPPKKSLTVAVA
jgi:hypothetical protein